MHETNIVKIHKIVQFNLWIVKQLINAQFLLFICKPVICIMDINMKHHHASYTVITYSNVTQIISNHQISLSKLTRLALNTGLIVWRWFAINYARRDYAVFISFSLLITIKGTNGWRAQTELC